MAGNTQGNNLFRQFRLAPVKGVGCWGRLNLEMCWALQ